MIQYTVHFIYKLSDLSALFDVMKEIHRHWPLIGRCIRRQRNRNCPRPDLASGKMGRDALKFTGHRNEATRPHMAPYGPIPLECLRMSGEYRRSYNRSLGMFGYFGISCEFLG